MLDRKIFVVILLLLVVLVLSLKYEPEHFTDSEDKRIKNLEKMIKNLNNSFKSTIDLFSEQKFKGFEGPRGVEGQQGPAGGENIVHQRLLNLNKSNKYATITAGVGKNSVIYMSNKPNQNSNFANFTQEFQYTKDHQIKPLHNPGLCMTYEDGDIFMNACSTSANNNQRWKFDNNTLKSYADEGKCVSIGLQDDDKLIQGIGDNKIFNKGAIDKLITVPCDTNSIHQQDIPSTQQWSLQ